MTTYRKISREIAEAIFDSGGVIEWRYTSDRLQGDWQVVRKKDSNIVFNIGSGKDEFRVKVE